MTDLLEPTTVRFPDRRHREVVLNTKGIAMMNPLQHAQRNMDDILNAIDEARMHLHMTKEYEQGRYIAYSLDLVSDMVRSYQMMLDDDLAEFLHELQIDPNYSDVVDDDPLGETPVEDGRIPPRYVSGD